MTLVAQQPEPSHPNSDLVVNRSRRHRASVRHDDRAASGAHSPNIERIFVDVSFSTTSRHSASPTTGPAYQRHGCTHEGSTLIVPWQAAHQKRCTTSRTMRPNPSPRTCRSYVP